MASMREMEFLLEALEQLRVARRVAEAALKIEGGAGDRLQALACAAQALGSGRDVLNDVFGIVASELESEAGDDVPVGVSRH